MSGECDITRFVHFQMTGDGAQHDVSKLDSFSRAMLKTGRALTILSAATLGLIPFGVVKIALGALQTVASFFGMLITAIPALKNKNGKGSLAFEYSFIHLKSGVGNIISGFIESIPFVSLIKCIITKDSRKNNGTAYDKQDDQYFKYVVRNSV